jgi:hypothetical protein
MSGYDEQVIKRYETGEENTNIINVYFDARWGNFVSCILRFPVSINKDNGGKNQDTA